MAATKLAVALTYLLVVESFVRTGYSSKVNNLKGKKLRLVTGNVSIHILISDVALLSRV